LPLKDRKKNTELRKILGLQSTELVIWNNSLRWFGHVKYKNTSHWVKHWMRLEVDGLSIRKWSNAIMVQRKI